MSIVDDLMVLADTYADGPHMGGYFGAHRAQLRAALESALQAEYERGRASPLAGCSDLRDAKWLDPECCEARACQSLRFKNERKPLTTQQIWTAVEEGIVGGIGFPSKAVAVARAIERAHGIGGNATTGE